MKPSTTRRAGLALLAGAAVLALPAAIAQPALGAWPNRPINLVVAWPPGGSVDVVARLMAEALRQKLGQTVVVSNRGGATGTIGANAVAKAPPDGYTFLMTIGAYPISAALMPNLPYDPIKDLAPVSLIVRAPNMLVVRPDFPARNLAELVALAKAAPGKYTYSTAGNGTTTHLMVEMLGQASGTSFTHVPYQGGAASLQAILSSQTDLNSAVTSTAAPQIAAGKLRPLAVIGMKRMAAYPDVQTFAEAGYPGVRGDSWIGLFAPGGTPRAIVNQMNDAVQAIVATPANHEKLLQQAGEPVNVGPDEFAKIVRDEIRDFTGLAKALNLKP